MEQLIDKMVRAGKATIPVRDRRYTVYIPIDRDASVIFDKFANWCTAKADNGNFKHYVENKTPFGKRSSIYIIIDNGFFKGESDSLYQIHFETHQVRDRAQKQINFYSHVLKNSEAISNYFKDELIRLAKESLNRLDNKYVSYLKEFNLAGEMIELYDDNTPYLLFKGQSIKDLKDISRFKELKELIIIDCKMEMLKESIVKLENLDVLSIPQNRVTEIPSFLGYCRSLIFINLKGNKIHSIPDTIGNLDKSNGGSLEYMAVNPSDIGETNFKKLKSLLPKTEFIT